MHDLTLGGKYEVKFDGPSTAQLMLAGFQVGGWAAAAEQALQAEGYHGAVVSNARITADPADPSGGLATVDVDLTNATAPSTASSGGIVRTVVLPIALFAAAVAAAIFSPLAGVVLAVAAVIVLLEAPAQPGSPLNPSPGSPLYGGGGRVLLLGGLALAGLVVLGRGGAKA